MNLHGIVSSKVSVVNPTQNVSVQVSTGYAINPDGSRTPSYSSPITVPAQVQELTTHDLRQLDGLNIQGSQRAIYFPGDVSGIFRFSQQGGDLVTIKDGTVWLTTAVLERWPNWTKVSVTLQNSS